MRPELAEILLIHNSDDSAKTLQEVLEKSRHEIHCAHSLKKGVSQLQSNYSIDLIILEAGLQYSSRLNLFEILRSSPKYHFMPVIVVYGGSDDKVIRRCIGLGARNIVSYPCPDELLAKKIDMAVSNGKPVVLIADENDMLLGHLAYVAELEGFKTLAAKSGEKVLGLLKTSKIAAVVADSQLSKMSGPDLIAGVRNINPDVPVIMMAGCKSQSTRKDVESAGVNGFLTKPVKNTEFSGLLRRLVLKKEKLPAAC
jgi:DNA-binding response OmpR family regulator